MFSISWTFCTQCPYDTEREKYPIIFVRMPKNKSPFFREVALRTLLSFAQLRPVTRAVAKRLVKLTAVGAWQRVVDARMEDQWELWDVLNLLHAGGYDVTRLWKADPGEDDAFCAVIPPEPFRLYSIASAAPPGQPATTLRLVVAGLSYSSAQTPWSYPRERQGTASHFLRRASADGRHRLSLQIVSAPRFRLPADPATPVVMFAAGSGIAPFLGFVAARTGSGENRLYLGIRTPEEFVEQRRPGRGGSRGPAGTLRRVLPRRCRDRFRRPAPRRPGRTAAPGGRRDPRRGRRTLGPAAVHRRRRPRRLRLRVRQRAVRGLRAPGADRHRARRRPRNSSANWWPTDGLARTSSPPIWVTPSRVLASRCRIWRTHNTSDAGYWMAIGGAVFDVTEFQHLHIGGAHIVRNHVGLDATAAYRKVLHHAHCRDRRPTGDVPDRPSAQA